MSDRVERIQTAFEAFNRRDLDGLVALCAPDVEWTPPAELPGSRTYYGHDGVREAIGDMLSVFSDLKAEPARFIEDGDRVVALYLWRGSADGSGASLDPFEVHAGGFCEFEGEVIKMARFWTTWEEALAAADLTEADAQA